jgi:hypothetical protein
MDCSICDGRSVCQSNAAKSLGKRGKSIEDRSPIPISDNGTARDVEVVLLLTLIDIVAMIVDTRWKIREFLRSYYFFYDCPNSAQDR